MSRHWIAFATAIAFAGCGGQVEGPASGIQGVEPLASGQGGDVTRPSPSGCVECNDDALCNFCSVQLTGQSYRCPVATPAPSPSCWSLGEVYSDGAGQFTCYYC